MWILIPAAYVTNLMTFMNKNCKFKTSNCHVIREEGGADAGISSNRNRIEDLFFSNLEFVLWNFWFNKKIDFESLHISQINRKNLKILI